MTATWADSTATWADWSTSWTGTATTYTYAGSTITRTSTGLYTKNITASAAGLLVLGPTTDAIFFTVTPASGSALIYSYQFSYVIV